MHEISKQARVAGWMYLTLAVTAPFSLIYVPGRLVVKGDAAATAANIRGAEMLFRAGVVGQVLTGILFALVVLALYRLLARVHRTHATVMVLLALFPAATGLVQAANDLVALQYFQGAPFLAGLDRRQLDALGYMALRTNGLGTTISELFWGLWLFPFGWLVFRSGFLPRVLGVLLLANGAAYAAMSLTGLLWPAHAALVSRVTFPLLFGEMVIALWMAFLGARPRADGPLREAA